jgi:Na+/H+ antiporter NhaD/arsenite permease-like protein
MTIFGIISVAAAVILLMNGWNPITTIVTIIIIIFILNGIQDFKGVRIILSQRLKEKNKRKELK